MCNRRGIIYRKQSAEENNSVIWAFQLVKYFTFDQTSILLAFVDLFLYKGTFKANSVWEKLHDSIGFSSGKCMF